MKENFCDCLEICYYSSLLFPYPQSACTHAQTTHKKRGNTLTSQGLTICVQDQVTKMIPLSSIDKNYHTNISTITSESDFYINSYHIQHIMCEHILIISLYLFGIPSSNLALLCVIFKSKQQ